MESVLRAAAVYLLLFAVLRLSGKRALAEITTFDFILILIIGEATQNALLADNYSLTNCFLVILTLIFLDVVFTLWKLRSRRVDLLLEDAPLVIVENGKVIKDRIHNSAVDESDILQAARERQGLERMEQIKFAVLERNGGISIIPQERL
jgi:uncharacterized membrane protein YcaP (DUF421 family)